MIRFTNFALTIAASFAISSAAPLDPGHAQAGRAASSRAVVLTPDGGFRTGAAAARVRLVEYISYTCNHCADFAAQSHQALTVSYLTPGTTSVEIRPMVRDILDLTSAVLARCGPPARFFDRHNALMARQGESMAAAQRTSTGWAAVPQAQRLARIAGDTGLIAALRPAGLTPAAANACLADTAQVERIIAISQTGAGLGVTSTPSFLINGALVADVHDWASLRPRLDAALTAR